MTTLHHLKQQAAVAAERVKRFDRLIGNIEYFEANMRKEGAAVDVSEDDGRVTVVVDLAVDECELPVLEPNGAGPFAVFSGVPLVTVSGAPLRALDMDLDGFVSKAEVPEAPEPDAPVPELDAPAPEPDAPVPELDAPVPEPDAPVPELDASVPKIDASVPEPDVPEPEKPKPAVAPAPQKKQRGQQVGRHKVKLTPGKPVTYRTGPYLESEISQIHALLDEGATYSTVAKALGRKPSAVSVKLAKIRKDRAATAAAETPPPVTKPAKAAKPAQQRVPQPTPPPAPPTAAPVKPPAATAAPGEIIPSVQRYLEAHLNALGYPWDWSAARDYELVVDIIAGRPLAVLADEYGYQDAGPLRERWRALNKKPGDLDHQALLLKVLKARAGL